MTDSAAADAIQIGLEHHQRGDLIRAEAIYRQVLEADPENPDALHLLGVIAYQAGKNELSVELIRRAISFNPAVPDFYNNLGNSLRLLAKLDEAVAAFRSALNLSPRFVEARHNLGLALRDQGRTEEAIRCFRKALKLQPDLPDLHNSLGLALLDETRNEEAIRAFERALKLRPDFAQAHNNLGLAFKALGKTDEALRQYLEALRLSPGLAEAHNNMGNLHRDEGRADEALACFREALRLNPRMIEANLNVATMMHDLGRLQEARALYAAVLSLKADHSTALWGQCIAQLEILYDNSEDIQASRQRYCSQLQSFIETTRLDTPARLETVSKVMGGTQPFYLAYQGEVDRDLQSKFGTYFCRVQAARFPRWSKRLRMPPAPSGAPLRVGVVSGYFRYHSNWKIPIKGWVENMDPRRFALYGYHTGKKSDAETEVARKSFVRFVERASSLEELAKEITADRLHALIYPEIGMDARSAHLAALHLAPIQCSSWGHPNTSGFPTLDYFLSSDLMEPPEADEHYSEKLVRLPNLSIYYTPPEVKPAAADRASFGLRKGAVLYFCAQSLFKYLPQYDSAIARIAAEAGDCQFVFLQFAKCREVGERFKARLGKAFAAHGLRLEDYVVLLPPQDPPHYQALNRISDVFLDSLGWSGCNSTLEAAGFGLPVVTMPGRLMRERHSVAILNMMGVRETIADSIEEYVNIAVRLGKDAGWRKQVSDEMVRNADKTYRDIEAVRGLERFIEETVASRLRS